MIHHPHWYTFVYFIASPNHRRFSSNKISWLHIHTNKSSTKFQFNWTSCGSTVKCSKVDVLWTLPKMLSPPNDTSAIWQFSFWFLLVFTSFLVSRNLGKPELEYILQIVNGQVRIDFTTLQAGFLENRHGFPCCHISGFSLVFSVENPWKPKCLITDATPVFCKFLCDNTKESSEIWRDGSHWLTESYYVVFMGKAYCSELKIGINDFTISLRGGWLY